MEHNNDNSYEKLDQVKTCPLSGKKYDAIRKVKCGCICHDPEITAMHIMPCCDGGYIEERRYID